MTAGAARGQHRRDALRDRPQEPADQARRADSSPRPCGRPTCSPAAPRPSARLTRSSGGTVRVTAVPSAIATLLFAGDPRPFRTTHPEVRLEIQRRGQRRRCAGASASTKGPTSASSPPTPTRRVSGSRSSATWLGIVFRPGAARSPARIDDRGAAPSWTLLGLEPLILNPLCGLVDHADIVRLAAACNLQAANTTALCPSSARGSVRRSAGERGDHARRGSRLLPPRRSGNAAAAWT